MPPQAATAPARPDREIPTPIPPWIMGIESSRSRDVYKRQAFTSVTSIIVVLATGGFMTIPGLTSFLMDSIPAIVRELLWVGPALVGILLGWFLSPAPTAEAA